MDLRALEYTRAHYDKHSNQVSSYIARCDRWGAPPQERTSLCAHAALACALAPYNSSRTLKRRCRRGRKALARR